MERNLKERISSRFPNGCWKKATASIFFRTDRNQLPWKIFYNTNMPVRRGENVKNGLFDASSWKPLPSGLLGPVTLTGIFYE